MFDQIKRRMSDMRTIKSLCQLAEEHARVRGEARPGAEHFVLAALDLPDGTARRAFERLRVRPEDFSEAIDRQYSDALRNVGIDPPLTPDAQPLPASTGVYSSEQSAQALMQELSRRSDNNRVALLGAHVIGVAANSQYGVAARTLRALGIKQSELAEAAALEIQAAAVAEQR